MERTNGAAVVAEPGLTPEQALVLRARTDAGAFATLYDCYVDAIYRYAYRRLGSHEEAEDLTSQAFQQALQALPRYEPRGLPFGAWLFRIAHNLLVDRWRAGKGAVPLDGLAQDGLAGGEVGPEEALERQQELQGVWAAVAGLPALQRRAVVLRFGRDLSYAEIGPLIGRSEAASKQIIYRAMQTLRRRLDAGPGSQSPGSQGSGSQGSGSRNQETEGSC